MATLMATQLESPSSDEGDLTSYPITAIVSMAVII
jgi:hypothetical protein